MSRRKLQYRGSFGMLGSPYWGLGANPLLANEAPAGFDQLSHDFLNSDRLPNQINATGAVSLVANEGLLVNTPDGAVDEPFSNSGEFTVYAEFKLNVPVDGDETILALQPAATTNADQVKLFVRSGTLQARCFINTASATVADVTVGSALVPGTVYEMTATGTASLLTVTINGTSSSGAVTGGLPATTRITWGYEDVPTPNNQLTGFVRKGSVWGVALAEPPTAW